MDNFEKYLDVEILEANEKSAEARMAVRTELLDHIGHTAGGAYNALADAVGGAAARATGDLYVTQGCSLQYYVSTTPEDEYLYATATVRHRGSRTCIVAVELHHADGTVAADGQFSYSKV